MTVYVPEEFTPEEADVLRRYFTNLDGPVFALVNLPEVVKGALFARYSRSAKSLRRLFLDEFVGELDTTGDERRALTPYFTNLDGPVFALRNLPEVVKGALFARYSRSAKSLSCGSLGVVARTWSVTAAMSSPYASNIRSMSPT